MMKNERCNIDKNTSVFAALQSSLCYAPTRRRDKWILDIYTSLVYSDFRYIEYVKPLKKSKEQKNS